MAKTILFLGAVIFTLGLIFYAFEKTGMSYQNPLDFKFEKGNTKFYFPLGSSLLISIVLSLFFYYLNKWK
tara:strand:+ start:3922 stop:4131 length:210 start_codon:yes stop_codon:yes gene_type:complete